MQLHFSSFLMLSHAKESTGDSVCGNSGDNGHFGVSCLLLISHSFGVCVCVLTNPTRLRCIPQCTLSLLIRKTPLLCNLVSTKGVYVHNTCVTEGGDGKGQKAIVVVIVKSPYVRFNPI